MKFSEAFRREARDIIIGLVMGVVILLLGIGFALTRGELDGVVALSGILCFVLVVLVISYWGDKKTYKEIQQGEAREEEERRRQLTISGSERKVMN